MISVVTDPLLYKTQFFSEGLRKIARRCRDSVRKPEYNYGKYRGHYAVTRSLIEGLKIAGIPHNYNPTFSKDLARTVLVLAGVRTLKQAIKFKEIGLIDKLFAGPNIVLFSSDHNSLLANPLIDKVITPCDWVSNHYIEHNPSLENRCLIWPAGVETTFWKPCSLQKRRRILIFEKQNKGPVGPVEPYVQYIKGLGYEVEVIKYGSFKHPQYLECLQNAQLMLGFVVDESQGLAWAEAWSTNVPTLLWRNEINTHQGVTYQTSTAPYLTNETGLFFDDIDDFKLQFNFWEKNKAKFRPREWTMKNMSDEVCAQRLIDMIDKC